MGDLGTVWLATFDTLLVEVRKVTGLDDTNTFQGYDKTPIGDPLVLIGTGNITQMARDTGGTYYSINWPIVIIVENPDLKQGLLDTFDWAGNIRNELLDDRTLGGVVDNVEDPVYAPNGLAGLPGFERKHLVLNVQTLVWVDDPT